MMTAKQANNKAQKNVDDQDGKILDIIEQKIEEAVLKGLFSISYKGVLSRSAASKLRNLGYAVVYSSERNEDWIKISWC